MDKLGFMDFNTRLSPKDLGKADSYAGALVHPLLANSTLYPSLLVTCHRNDKDSACFYHSDYFVSTSYITNDAGNVSQTLNYLPYGEDWVDLQYSLDYRLGQYTFTGKERDEDTGYGYFGARYMDHELMTMWLSVDPMADKYPSISLYAYCAWNSVKLAYPDGKEISIHTDEEGNVVAVYNDGVNGVFRHREYQYRMSLMGWNYGS